MWIVVSSSVYSRITKIRGGVHDNMYATIRKKSIIEARFFLEQTLTFGLCHFTHAFGDQPPQQHHLLLILSWASLGFDWSSNLFAISYPSSLRHIVQIYLVSQDIKFLYQVSIMFALYLFSMRNSHICLFLIWLIFNEMKILTCLRTGKYR